MFEEVRFIGNIDAQNEVISLSFSEMIEALDVKPGIPCVPNNTYKDAPQNCMIPGYVQLEDRYHINRGDIPVVMKGAWARLSSHRPYNEFRLSVAERYIRLHKLTIFCWEDAEKVADKLYQLYLNKPGKRWCYHQSNRWLDASDFYMRSDGHIFKCFIEGERQPFIEKDKIPIIKSIRRQIDKLDKKFNNKGKTSWQKLIQQAI